MGAPGSGRRRIKATRKGFSLSAFSGTEDSVKIRLGEIQEGVIGRDIDPRTADTLITAEKAKLTAIRQEKSSAELDELREMLKDAKAVQREAKRIEVAHRQHLNS